MSSLGSFVSSRRKTLGLTQQNLAESLGYTVQAISKFENGQSEMDLSSLPELAKALGLSLDDLFHEKNGSSSPCSLHYDQGILSKNLAYLRLNKNLTQEEVAEAVHVSKRSIANYEAGASAPTPTTILYYLTSFQIDADQLFGTVLSPTPIPTAPKKASKKPWIMLLAVLLVLGLATGIGVPLILNAQKEKGGSSASSSYPSSYTTSSMMTSSASSSFISTTSVSASNSAFSGLNSFQLLHEGKSNEILTPGTYKVSVLTDPTNYFQNQGIDLGWSWTLSKTGVTLSPVTDPYGEQSIVIDSSAIHGEQAILTVSAVSSGSLVSASYTLTINNPTSEIDPVHFPGVEYFYLTYKGEPSASLAPGTYTIDVVIGPTHPDFSNGYAFGQISFPTNITGASTKVAFESISLWISPNCADGLKVTVRASLAETSTQVHFSSSPDFIVTVVNPGGS